MIFTCWRACHWYSSCCNDVYLLTSLSLIQFMLHGVLMMALRFLWQKSMHCFTYVNTYVNKYLTITCRKSLHNHDEDHYHNIIACCTIYLQFILWDYTWQYFMVATGRLGDVWNINNCLCHMVLSYILQTAHSMAANTSVHSGIFDFLWRRQQVKWTNGFQCPIR